MNTRKIAYEIITDVLQNDTFLNLTLKNSLRNFEAQDKRFISALCFTTIENLIRIDYIIKQFTKGQRVHKDMKNVLRIGVAQLMYFESVPERAAVNESVDILPKKDKRQRGFANAVLRRIAKELGAIRYPDPQKEPVKFLSVMYSYPEWLCEKYLKDYGRDFAEQMLSYSKPEAYTCVRVNTCKMPRDEFEKELKNNGIIYKNGKYIEDAFYIKHIDAIENMPLYTSGAMTVQSEASMLCVQAGEVKDGIRVLDTCAAPGGKAAYIASINQTGEIVAAELYPHRAALMAKNFERLGVTNVEIAVLDGTVFQPQYEKNFDCVIIDAPCSALGLLYRKPDIKYAKKEEDLENLVKIQKDLLETCCRYVKEGGTLVYSTCTINLQENMNQIKSFLARHCEFKEKELKNILPVSLLHRVKGGTLQLFPHIDEIDGFFMASMEKTK